VAMGSGPDGVRRFDHVINAAWEDLVYLGSGPIKSLAGSMID